MQAAANSEGAGVVATRTFLGSVTRIAVLLSGDTTVQVDVPSATAAATPPGTSVQVTLTAAAVMIAPRRQPSEVELP